MFFRAKRLSAFISQGAKRRRGMKASVATTEALALPRSTACSPSPFNSPYLPRTRLTRMINSAAKIIHKKYILQTFDTEYFTHIFKTFAPMFWNFSSYALSLQHEEKKFSHRRGKPSSPQWRSRFSAEARHSLREDEKCRVELGRKVV